jgi:hypothetical protein
LMMFPWQWRVSTSRKSSSNLKNILIFAELT